MNKSKGKWSKPRRAPRLCEKIRLFAIAAIASANVSAYDLVYYATADATKDPSGTADCLTPETPGVFANAMAKLTGNLGSGKSGIVYFEDGDYDCTTYTHGTDDSIPECLRLGGSQINRHYYFASLSGNPEKCRLVGGGTTAHRFACGNNNSTYSHYRNLCFTNFYGSGSIVCTRANYNTLYDFSNCVFRANGLLKGSYGGCFRGQGTLWMNLECRDCRFYGNVATYGGVSATGDHHVDYHPRFYDCAFGENQAIRNASDLTQSGAGGVAYGGGEFVRCTFKANKSCGSHENAGSGGVGYAKFSPMYFTDCVFDGNMGLYPSVRGNYTDRNRVVLTRCTTRNQNGAVTRVVCQNCTFTNNASNGVTLGDDSAFTNCLFTANVVKSDSAFPFIRDSSTVINCTIVSNYNRGVTQNDWGHSMVFGSSCHVANSVIVDNDCVYAFGCFDANNPLVATNCVYMGGRRDYCTSQGSTQLCSTAISPTFCGATAVKFALKGDWPFTPRRSSMLRDTGIPVDAGDTDLAGKDRVIGPAIDIGAFEYAPSNLGLMINLR